MSTLYETFTAPSAIDARISATVVIEFADIGPEGLDAVTSKIADCAKAFEYEGPMRVESDYSATRSILEITISGGIGAMAFLNRKTGEGDALFDHLLTTHAVVVVDPMRYELSIAVNDHLLAAAKNHPRGGRPLQLQLDYDEDAERMKISIDASLFATGYILMLTELHVSQSRFA